MPSIASFNANNFFLRYRFTRTYPGDMSQKSLVEAGQIGLVGYLPGLAFDQYPSSYIVWDQQRRELAARALAEPDGQLPDILCFQEVENIHAIRKLNQTGFDYVNKEPLQASWKRRIRNRLHAFIPKPMGFSQ